MTSWIKVEDRLPKHLQEVFVKNNFGATYSCIYLSNTLVKEYLEKFGVKPQNDLPENVFAVGQGGLHLQGIVAWMEIPE